MRQFRQRLVNSGELHDHYIVTVRRLRNNIKMNDKYKTGKQPITKLSSKKLYSHFSEDVTNIIIYEFLRTKNELLST